MISCSDVQEFAKSQNTLANQPPSFNNLEHLTGDKTIFIRLHQKFTSLLARLATSKTEFAVIGAPVQCTLAFNESRIMLLVKLVSSLSRRHSGVMLYNLLTGQGLEISCLADNNSSTDIGYSRQTNRIVADALASLLPNNKRAEPVYFANVLLTLFYELYHERKIHTYIYLYLLTLVLCKYDNSLKIYMDICGA